MISVYLTASESLIKEMETSQAPEFRPILTSMSTPPQRAHGNCHQKDAKSATPHSPPDSAARAHPGQARTLPSGSVWITRAAHMLRTPSHHSPGSLAPSSLITPRHPLLPKHLRPLRSAPGPLDTWRKHTIYSKSRI